MPTSDVDVLYTPPVAEIAPNSHLAQSAEARACSRGTARNNAEIRTPRPTTMWTTSQTSGLEGTTLNITDVRSMELESWQNLANEGAAHNRYLVLYQEGDVVTAQWETRSDIE